MMHTPQVLFVDEPRTGLDPAARLFVWAGIRDLTSATPAPGDAQLLFPEIVALTSLQSTGSWHRSRRRIAFSLVLTPPLFTGCSQCPWPTLDRLRWFQVVTGFNPLTYVSEGMRAALMFSLAVFAAIGIRGFIRRSID